MLEDKKIVELNDKDLQKVSGRTIPLPDHDFWDSWNPYFN